LIAIVQRIALERLLNPPSVNFDLEPTPFQLKAVWVIGCRGSPNLD